MIRHRDVDNVTGPARRHVAAYAVVAGECCSGLVQVLRTRVTSAANLDHAASKFLRLLLLVRIVAADAAEFSLALPVAITLIQTVAMVIDLELLALRHAFFVGVDVDKVVRQLLSRPE